MRWWIPLALAATAVAVAALGAVAMRPAATATPTVLAPADVAAFLRADSDGYVAHMTPMDLRARRAATAAEYVARSADDALAVAVTPAQERTLAADCSAADRFFADTARPQMAALPWKLAFTAAYEDGLPHTRADIVFLPIAFFAWDRETRVQTLVHEKVHIFQRAYPDAVARMLAPGYERLARRDARSANSTLRSNPDVDAWTYAPRDGGAPMGVHYVADPHKIGDVVGDAHTEHPYEVMAYAIDGAYKEYASR